jgi:hypothetical protein
MLKTSAAMELALRFLGTSSTRESTLERMFSVSVMFATVCGELNNKEFVWAGQLESWIVKAGAEDKSRVRWIKHRRVCEKRKRGKGRRWGVYQSPEAQETVTW